jgi:hypothetical protein
MRRGLAQPQDALHPPPLPVVHELDAVDAALERFLLLATERRIRAPRVRDRPELLDPTRDLDLTEADAARST